MKHYDAIVLDAGYVLNYLKNQDGSVRKSEIFLDVKDFDVSNIICDLSSGYFHETNQRESGHQSKQFHLHAP